MMMNIVKLTVFNKKGEPGIALSKINLIKNLGIEGDFHQGGEKQITLLSVEIRRWLDTQAEKGLCFDKFKENILFDGLNLNELKPGNILFIGDAVLRISAVAKPCFDECPLAIKNTLCRLSRRAVFATAEESGTIRIEDKINIDI